MNKDRFLMIKDISRKISDIYRNLYYLEKALKEVKLDNQKERLEFLIEKEKVKGRLYISLRNNLYLENLDNLDNEELDLLRYELIGEEKNLNVTKYSLFSDKSLKRRDIKKLKNFNNTLRNANYEDLKILLSDYYEKNIDYEMIYESSNNPIESDYILKDLIDANLEKVFQERYNKYIDGIKLNLEPLTIDLSDIKADLILKEFKKVFPLKEEKDNKLIANPEKIDYLRRIKYLKSYLLKFKHKNIDIELEKFNNLYNEDLFSLLNEEIDYENYLGEDLNKYKEFIGEEAVNYYQDELKFFNKEAKEIKNTRDVSDIKLNLEYLKKKRANLIKVFLFQLGLYEKKVLEKLDKDIKISKKDVIEEKALDTLNILYNSKKIIEDKVNLLDDYIKYVEEEIKKANLGKKEEEKDLEKLTDENLDLIINDYDSNYIYDEDLRRAYFRVVRKKYYTLDKKSKVKTKKR